MTVPYNLLSNSPNKSTNSLQKRYGQAGSLSIVSLYGFWISILIALIYSSYFSTRWLHINKTDCHLNKQIRHLINDCSLKNDETMIRYDSISSNLVKKECKDNEKCINSDRIQHELNLIWLWAYRVKWSVILMLCFEILGWASINTLNKIHDGQELTGVEILASLYWAYFTWLPVMTTLSLFVIVCVVLRRRMRVGLSRLIASYVYMPGDTHQIKSKRVHVSTVHSHRFLDVGQVSIFYIHIRDSALALASEWSVFLVISSISTLAVIFMSFVLTFLNNHNKNKNGSVPITTRITDVVMVAWFYLILGYILFFAVASLSDYVENIVAILSAGHFGWPHEEIRVTRLITMIRSNPVKFDVAHVSITFDRLSVAIGALASAAVSATIRITIVDN